MRFLVRLLGGIWLATLVVSAGFAYLEVREEREREIESLTRRATLVGAAVAEASERLVTRGARTGYERVLTRFGTPERGLAIYDTFGGVLAATADVRPFLGPLSPLVSDAIRSNEPVAGFQNVAGRLTWVHVVPVQQDERAAGAAAVLLDAQYLDSGEWDLWRRPPGLRRVQRRAGEPRARRPRRARAGAGERARHRARAHHAGLRRRVGRPRQRQRRPRGRRAHRPALGGSGVHAAARVAERRGGGRLLLRLRQRGLVAALPHRPRAPALPRRRLGALSRGERALREGAAPGDGGGRGADRARAGLPLRAAAPSREGGAPRRARGALLAHSVAELRGRRHLPLAVGYPARDAGRRPRRLPHTILLQQLPRDRPARHRGADRMGPLHGRPRPAHDPRAAVSDQRRARPRRRGAAGRPRSRAGGVRCHRRVHRRRRRACGLHEGPAGTDPRAAAVLRALARVPPASHLHPDRLAEPQPHRALPGRAGGDAGDGARAQRPPRRARLAADRLPRAPSP